MKKILLSLLFVAGIAMLAPSAQAGCRRDYVIIGYDYCGRPVYGYVEHRDYYGDYDRYPVRYGGYDYDDYRVHRHYHHPRVGFSFFFGR